MALWRIDIYQNKDDEFPCRSGYVHAEDETEAGEKVIKAMADHPRGDAIVVRSHSVPSIPTDKILWDLSD